ncbi:hypothetical protein, partial [Arthrobacter sp. I3]|uniref:hypothetical protein n=1 Tax=Arthrobacter sp. I3 TaxID=218158 RepID=UPI001C1E6A17
MPTVPAAASLSPAPTPDFYRPNPSTKPCEDPMTTAHTAPDTRSEHDLLGDRDVPAGAYWG